MSAARYVSAKAVGTLTCVFLSWLLTADSGGGAGVPEKAGLRWAVTGVGDD